MTEERYTHAECGQCGWLGLLQDLKDHPTRPMPLDLGFCPDCGCEIDEMLTKSEADAIIASYD